MEIKYIESHPDGSVTIYYADGTSKKTSAAQAKEFDNTGDDSGGSGGVLGSILGAIPGILAALFPSGLGGNGTNNYPTVTTPPGGGPATVNLAGSNTNNILLIVVIAMFVYIVFIGKQPAKAKK